MRINPRRHPQRGVDDGSASEVRGLHLEWVDDHEKAVSYVTAYNQPPQESARFSFFCQPVTPLLVRSTCSDPRPSRCSTLALPRNDQRRSSRDLVRLRRATVSEGWWRWSSDPRHRFRKRSDTVARVFCWSDHLKREHKKWREQKDREVIYSDRSRVVLRY